MATWEKRCGTGIQKHRSSGLEILPKNKMEPESQAKAGLRHARWKNKQEENVKAWKPRVEQKRCGQLENKVSVLRADENGNDVGWIEILPSFRHCAKCFSCIISFNPQNISKGYYYPHFRDEETMLHS